jgi:TolB-like protein/Tfp pilus assembly protein PilF
VAGRAPFQGATASHIIVSILENNPPPLERPAGGVPAELERIVSKALAKDREGRYQTIKDLMIDLRNLKQRSEFEAEKERSEHPVLARGAIAPIAEAAGPKYKRILLSILAAFFAVPALTYLFYVSSHSKAAIDSLAVLPFVNTSADPDAEYLSDGITESLINSLSKLPAIRVIARSSVFRYKGHQMDPQAAGRELGVTAVLTGRVMQRGDNLTISAELVNTRDNRHMWGEQYNRRLSDLIVVQQDIVNQMSDQLRPQLTGEQRRQALKNYTANIDAYELYLKGRYYFNKTTDVAFQKSMTYFQQAVRIDPNYALAYAGIADSYYGLSWSTLSSSEAMPKARAAAEDALRIDESLPEGHTSLAMVKWLYDWKWSEAEQEFRRALVLNPSYAFAHQQYGIFLALMGRFDESQAELRNAKKLDPLSLWVNADLALSLYFARRYDQAIVQLQSTLDMDPNFENAHWMLWTIYEQKGMHAKAVDEYLKAASEIGTTTDEIAALKKTYETAGWDGFLEQRLKQFLERSKRGYLSPRFIAEAYIDLGERDQAFEWLDKAVQSRDSVSIWLKVHPEFDPLRSDPRFEELMRRVGLPP